MSEEEIINYLKVYIYTVEQQIKNGYLFLIADTEKEHIIHIKGLLDLYDKEKEKNAKLIDELYELKAITNYYNAIKVDNLKFNEDTKMIIADSEYFDKGYFKETFISKNKIREKIKEVENGNENYTFEKLTSSDIRRTVVTNLKELLEE